MFSSPQPDPGAIEVWQLSLEILPHRQTALARLLSPDERERAARFRFEADRRRYITARGTLRLLLGRCLNRAPGALEFRYGAHGKPALSPAASASPLFFNLSHTADLALCAITRLAPVGIDLERRRPDLGVEELIALVCAPAEAAALAALPPPLRRERFYRYWTRKEAYCKARGDGLTQELTRLDVSLPPQPVTDWFHLRRAGAPDTGIALQDLEIAPDYAAALAIEGPPAPITRRIWTERECADEANFGAE